mgnify:FL=1
MRLGNKEIISFFLSFFLSFSLFAEDKIISTPLINLNELKPSFEETDDSIKDLSNSGKLKDRKKIILQNKSSSAKFIGLDKITAKTSDILINLGETKKFGPLEIKVLECGKIRSKNKKDNSVAYLQVKDISENENEKVFIFNGWTFSSDPTLAPFDHAIYDLQLITCNNV